MPIKQILADKTCTKDEDGRYHSFNDKPAIEYSNGIKVWYKNGKIHRLTGAAVVFPFGLALYYKNGKLGSDCLNPVRNLHEYVVYGNLKLLIDENDVFHSYKDKPALISSKHCKWYKRGKLHREGDKPAVITKKGDKMWYINNLLHRENGPAVILANGKLLWYKNGKACEKAEVVL